MLNTPLMAQICPSAPAAPQVNCTDQNCLETNACPLDYLDLNDLVTEIAPSGYSLVWSNDANPSDGLEVISDGIITSSGVFYAYYYNATDNCYTEASTSVEVTIISCPVEICDNRIDDDGDGLVDCMDPDCSGNETCWECVTEFYQVHSNQYLVSLDPSNGTYTTLAEISNATEVNGAQFNPIDGHVYAPSKIGGEHVLGRIHQDGEVFNTGLALPGNGIFYVGAIDADGTMFISNSGGIHSIDLTADSLEVIHTGISHPGVADFALDITRGLFYGINGSAQLKVFDPINLNVKTYNLGGSINNDSGGYGAAWSSNDGSFYAYNNSSGKVYSVNVNTLTATLILNATGNLSINDGFNCVLAPPPFESNCSNGVDDDGDGLVDCDDPDCTASDQCTIEICDNGIDDDGDGWIDCSDSECYSLSFCIEICDNGIDDNGNGLIDSDDPQCSTSSGVTGGLESNRRLSDKIANRNFLTRVLQPKEFKQALRGAIPFEMDINRNPLDIASYIPTELHDAYVAESSPTDLIDITNATDVAAADYYINDQRVASVLGIYSVDGVYEHSKYICDRLDGSRLLDISYLFANGGNFISYELLNQFGQAEYAVSFSARYDSNEGFKIENHWNLHKFQADEDYYNFQIWANSYVELIILLEDILDQMEESVGIASIEYSEIPSAFVMYGDYENGKLALQIRNKNLHTNLDLTTAIRRHENGSIEYVDFNIPLTGNGQENILVNTGHLYDLGASLNFQNSASDEIFVADGMWGTESSEENATITSFETNEDLRTTAEDEYQIERAISLEASVKTYMNIFRSLDAKFKPHNVNEFNSLVFNAFGKGNIEVTIVKSSIEKWEEQFRTQILITEDEQTFRLRKEDFVSTVFDAITFDDVTTIVFSIIGNNEEFEEVQLNLSDVSFKNTTVSNSKEITLNSNISFSPNPALDFINLKIESERNDTYALVIYNQLGQIITERNISVSTGTNSFDFDLSDFIQGSYTFSLRGSDGITQSGKFIKIN